MFENVGKNVSVVFLHSDYFFQKWMTELLYNNESELLPKVGCSS